MGNKFDFNKGLAELEMIINKMESGPKLGRFSQIF